MISLSSSRPALARALSSLAWRATRVRRPYTRLAVALLPPLTLLAPPCSVRAQESLAADPAAFVLSTGQPSLYRPYIGAFGGWDHRDGNAGVAAHALVGVSRDLYYPVVGIVGAAVEGYSGTVGESTLPPSHGLDRILAWWERQSCS